MTHDNPVPRRFSFPKSRRLLSAAEFQNVLSSECRSGDRMFAVTVRRNSITCGRLGVAVARKVSPRAHERNRIKRCIREAFRLNQADVAGFDIVVVARPGSAQSDGLTLRGSLMRHLDRLRRRCAAS